MVVHDYIDVSIILRRAHHSSIKQNYDKKPMEANSQQDQGV